MNLEKLKSIIYDLGGKKIYVKKLAPNDNSKNQVYLGGSFDILNIFPISEIYSDTSGDWKKERFKASVNYSWINEDGSLTKAPHAQFILYPKYPEIRFSGFLKKSTNSPSELMTQRLADRLLFLSITNFGEVIGYVTHPESNLAKEVDQVDKTEEYGIFKVISSDEVKENKNKLINELKRIHNIGWIDSKKLDKNGNIGPCNAPQCGGYTLEAELGVRPNGYSEPDYLGWEIKQFGVANFARYNNSVITLMTPEPTGGLYKEKGIKDFLFKYGYNDLRGREDRINFGGIHKVGKVHFRTGLRIELLGFDIDSGKIRNTDGKIVLLDKTDNEVATWSFVSMLKHWNRKHNQACYVPSISQKIPSKSYWYGNKLILGSGTDFQFFLKEMSVGNIYYDPGIKMENVSTHPHLKARSQFRIKSMNLGNLYKVNEILDLSHF